MIGYICKYTPVEILESFGESVIKIDPSVTDFYNSDALLHPNLCFYSKAVLEYCLNNNLDKIVLVNCCDSIKRLYDTLKLNSNINFIHMIDLPRKNSCCSVDLFRKELLKFINHYETYSNKDFDENKLKNIVNNKPIITDLQTNSNINIGILGARFKPTLIDSINAFKGSNVINLTCTSNFGLYNKIEAEEDILTQYAKNILNYYPCLRMADVNNRYTLLSKKLSGIIYHTVKFCDFYSYEYAKIKNELDLPILKIETDYSTQSEGQLKTRIDAFMESLSPPSHKALPSNNSNITKKNIDKKFFLGIDSGSTSTNSVIIDENKKILAYSIVRTSSKSSIGLQNALDDVLKKCDISLTDISYIVSTGYGRISIPFSNKSVTEITCHGKGANFLNPSIRTIIDIGGQDSKAIKIDSEGNVLDFLMNDKCAAGTGKFLEMMSKTLEISIDEMGPLSLKSKENISITSMCSVFAESEVISLIAENKEKSDIVHGLCNSVANRTTSLVNRLNIEENFMMTGGVAKNIGVVKCIEKKLSNKLFIPKEPEIVGALGAALIGLENYLPKY